MDIQDAVSQLTEAEAKSWLKDLLARREGGVYSSAVDRWDIDLGLNLTPKQRALLEVLVRYTPYFVAWERLFTTIYPPGTPDSDIPTSTAQQAVSSHLKRLREKILPHRKTIGEIITGYGTGARFEKPKSEGIT